MGGRRWGRRSRTSRRSRMGEVAGARVIYPRRSWSPPQLVSGLNCGHCPPLYNLPPSFAIAFTQQLSFKDIEF